MSKNLFITGTGTDVGKTFVTGLILKALKTSGYEAAYYKAAMSGNDRREDGTLIPGDAQYVKAVSGISQPLEEMCPYIYENAVSPHLASQMEGNPVCLEKVTEQFRDLCHRYDFVTVEGSGGILCPLRFDREQKILLTDVVRACDLGCVLVADAGLGTINSVVLAAEYMKNAQIPLKGIIFNHFIPNYTLHEDNLKMCEAFTGVPVIACVRSQDTEFPISSEQLLSFYE